MDQLWRYREIMSSSSYGEPEVLSEIEIEIMPKRIFQESPGRRKPKEDHGKGGWTV